MSGPILPRGGGSQTATSVLVRDLDPRTSDEQALTYLETLHGTATGYVLLTLIGRGATRRVITGADHWPDARDELRGTNDWWAFARDNYPRWDVYTAVCGFRRRPSRGSRGLTKDVLDLPGVFADLDVKPEDGAFRTTAELETFLAKLPPATMRVNTGSGGAHVYWLFTERISEQSEAQHLLDGWYDYLCHHARDGDYAIDHVQELSRILRVPGTVRWPKKKVGDGIAEWRAVDLAHASGPRYAAGDISQLVRPFHQEAVERHSTRRTTWGNQRTAVGRLLESWGLPGMQRALLEERFNQTEDWARLLEPLGWRLARDRRDGSGTSTDARYWIRPGNDASDHGAASTDSPRGRPGTMYIYTTDPSLDPCVIPDTDRFRRITTKYHFALHFHFNGDEAKLLEAIIQGKGQLP